ncbi:MAG: hypothetical protein ABJG55_03460 [Paracoccaceae bacterium]
MRSDVSLLSALMGRQHIHLLSSRQGEPAADYAEQRLITPFLGWNGFQGLRHG